MKYLFAYCLIITSIEGFGQKVALLDRKLKLPIIIADTVTMDQVNQGYLPVELKDLDTFYANLNYLEAMLSGPENTRLSSFELKAGPSVFLVTRMVKYQYNRYNITLSYSCNDVQSRYIIANGSDSKAEAKYKVKDIKNYLNSIKSMFRADYEIFPKMYNVLVYPE